MPEASNGKPANGAQAVLSTLAKSTDRLVQLGTLAFVALAGVGNWMATWKSADRNKEEIEVSRRVAWEGEQRLKAELVRQVAEIHAWMKEATEEFHRGNDDSAANRKLLNQLMREDLSAFERRQIASLGNQRQLLENDSLLIKEIHETLQTLKEWKKAEQMRGAPP